MSVYSIRAARALALLRILPPLLLLTGTTVGQTTRPPETGEPKAVAAEWRPLFDGRSLSGWSRSGFDAEGAVRVENPFRDGRAAIVMEAGAYLSGITWTRERELPRSNYEIALEAMKLEGSDFFCGLTFPVGESACSLIVGGWGGMVVGLSSVDDMDASENDTTGAMEFNANRWYRIRVRVTDERIEAWIDNRQMFELETKDRRIGLRWGDIDKSLPLGIAAYQTRAALRDIRLRRL
jgi:hypothetical protein